MKARLWQLYLRWLHNDLLVTICDDVRPHQTTKSIHLLIVIGLRKNYKRGVQFDVWFSLLSNCQYRFCPYRRGYIQYIHANTYIYVYICKYTLVWMLMVPRLRVSCEGWQDAWSPLWSCSVEGEQPKYRYSLALTIAYILIHASIGLFRESLGISDIFVLRNFAATLCVSIPFFRCSTTSLVRAAVAGQQGAVEAAIFLMSEGVIGTH